MRLVSEDIVIEHGVNAVRLRPSLRAAYILEAKHSFGHVMQGIVDLNVGVMADVIAATSNDPTARRLLIAKIDDNGVRDLQHLVVPFLDLLADCYGVRGDQEHRSQERERIGKRFSILDTLGEVYAVATGFLGWTPDAALDATPLQIVEASNFKQRTIVGDDKAEHDPRDEVSDDEVRSGIASLKANAKRGKQ